MKGAVGFRVGMIGLCIFAALFVLIPLLLGEALALFLIMFIAAFIFLNVMMIGFYRILVSLHEMIVYPDDPLEVPQRGRGLFFTGYIGLLVTLVLVLLLAVLPELTGRGGRRNLEVVSVLAWVVGWVFVGCLLGGILAMLRDLYHNAFYRSAVNPPRVEPDDELNIARGAARRGPRRATRNWEDD
jgi:hypothetical protein